MFADHYPVPAEGVEACFKRYASGEYSDKSIIGGCIRECFRDADLLLSKFEIKSKS